MALNFKKMGDASSSGALNYFRIGHYLVRVDSFRKGVNHNQIDFVKLDGTVLYVYPDAVPTQDPTTKVMVHPHRAGEQVVQKIMGGKDTTLGNIKHIICRCTDSPDSAVGEAEAEQALGDGQPLAGVLMEVHASFKITKAGKTFTNVHFVRRVPAGEVLSLMDAKLRDALFPNGALEAMAKEEAAAG